eukprot:6706390-Prymnesium_polylepis.3
MEQRRPNTAGRRKAAHIDQQKEADEEPEALGEEYQLNRSRVLVRSRGAQLEDGAHSRHHCAQLPHTLAQHFPDRRRQSSEDEDAGH